MKKSRNMVFLVLPLLVFLFLGIYSPAYAKASQSTSSLNVTHSLLPKDSFCECGVYVKNVVSPLPVPNDAYVKSWLPDLATVGWRLDDLPQNGDIVVFQPGTYSFGVIPETGHTGIVTTLTGGYNPQNGRYEYRFTLRGAKQPGTTFSDAGCNNASYWNWIYFIRYPYDQSVQISFWSWNRH